MHSIEGPITFEKDKELPAGLLEWARKHQLRTPFSDAKTLTATKNQDIALKSAPEVKVAVIEEI